MTDNTRPLGAPPAQLRRRALPAVQALERALAAAQVDDLPIYVAECARLQATAMARLLLAQGVLREAAPAPPDALDLLSVPQVAAKLQMSRWGVYDLVRRQKLPAVRLGHKLRIRRAVAEAYVAEREGG